MPTVPAGLTAKDLTKTVYETIQYVNGLTGKTVAKTVTVPVTLTRNGHITYRDEAGNLLSTPTPTYDKWTPATFAAVDSPIIDGLFTTTPTVAETEIPTAIGVIRQVNYYPTDLTVTPGTPADPNDPNMVQGPIDPEVPDGDTGKNVPNKLNPQDPDSPVYPAGLQQPNLNQPATQTIRYVDIATGKELADPISNTLDFQRTATIHFDQAGTPTVQYNAWTPVTTDTFAAQTSPVIDGYVADRPTIDEMTLTDPVSMTLTVNYYHNYTVGPHEPVNPNDPIGPKNVGGTIDPKNPNSPVYPAGISTTDLNGTVTETIRYVDTNDKPVAPSVTQTINVERTALVAYNPDGSTTVTYTPWVVAGTDTFPAVDSPSVPGMTPDQKTIPAIEDPDGAPVSLVVIYTRNVGGGTGTANVPDGNDTPTVTPEAPAATPETPATTAKTPTATPKAKTPKSKTHQAKTPTPNAAPKTPAATANQTPNGGTKAPVAGPAGSPTATPNVTTPTDNNQPAATSETSAEKLPQTDDSSASATSALGILGMTLLGLFGLGKKRKRRED